MKKQSGFTLAELLVSLAVIGVSVTVGVPSYSTFMANQRHATLANTLVTTFNVARSEALKSRRHVTVCPSTDGESCSQGLVNWNTGWIVFANRSAADTATRDATDPVEAIIFRGAEPSGATTLTVSGFGNLVTYRPNGLVGTAAANQAATITLCDGKGNADPRAVVINRAGRARFSHHAADGSDLACATAL